jgi:hypothetical protein
VVVEDRQDGPSAVHLALPSINHPTTTPLPDQPQIAIVNRSSGKTSHSGTDRKGSSSRSRTGGSSDGGGGNESRKSSSNNNHNIPHGSGSGGGGNNSSSSSRECVCGRGIACVGMTQAFRLLGDPRCYYVELPRYRKDPPAYKHVFRNNLREAYLRHIVRQNPSVDVAAIEATPKRRYVALHHFHPAVVRAFYENPLTSAQKHKVPISITEHELTQLGMHLYEEDQILSMSGFPTGGYYFVPNYPHDSSHNDLKTLIQAVRARRQQNPQVVMPRSGSGSGGNGNGIGNDGGGAIDRKHRNGPSSRREEIDPNLPMDIEIAAPKIVSKKDRQGKEQPEDTDDDMYNDDDYNYDDVVDGGRPRRRRLPKPKRLSTVEDAHSEEAVDESSRIVHTPTNEIDGDIPQSAGVADDGQGVYDDGWTHSNDFDSVWDKTSVPTEREIEAGVIGQTIMEEEEGRGEEGEGSAVGVEVPTTAVTPPSSASLASRRSEERPWATPKYRRARDTDEGNRILPGPADYIDPNETGDLSIKLASTPEIVDDGEDIARIAAGLIVYQQPGQKQQEEPKKEIQMAVKADSSPIAHGHLTRTKSYETPNNSQRKGMTYGNYSPNRRSGDDDTGSVGSADSGGTAAIILNHHMPGADPTLRIQVHNDLIAWESKRRSDLAQKLEYNREQWKAGCDILKEGIAEAQFAERLIYGICKASKLFADSLKAVYDDKLVDDRGNAVKNLFLQNRLAKQRSAFEYSIDNNNNGDDYGQAGQSSLLDSIVEAQLEVANAYVESSEHLEQDILPEIIDLRQEIQRDSKGLEAKGDSILQELKRSELEVKNIWGTLKVSCFDWNCLMEIPLSQQG